MAVREIVQMGHEALKRQSSPVEKIDNEILELIQDMKDTLYAGTGIGLAAPQIAVNKRVILIDLRDEMEPIVLINPKIVAKSGTEESEEGCLSYPGYFGFLERPIKVLVRGLNEKGESVEYKGEGLLGKAFCHEIDHLDGIMFTDRAYELYNEDDVEEEE